jgi:hypothetical protein
VVGGVVECGLEGGVVVEGRVAAEGGAVVGVAGGGMRRCVGRVRGVWMRDGEGRGAEGGEGAGGWGDGGRRGWGKCGGRRGVAHGGDV